MMQHHQQATALGTAREIDGAADRSRFQIEAGLRLFSARCQLGLPMGGGGKIDGVNRAPPRPPERGVMLPPPAARPAEPQPCRIVRDSNRLDGALHAFKCEAP